MFSYFSKFYLRTVLFKHCFPVVILLSVTNYAQEFKRPSYNVKTQFPIYEGEHFRIRFHAVNKKLPLYAAIILTCISNKQIVQELILNPGFLKALPIVYKGDFFNVKNYTVKPFLIDVILQFERMANNAQLEIMFFETDSRQFRINVADNPQEYPQFKLGTLEISLFLHWKLELLQKTLDHREDGLLNNSTNILICRAAGGYPFSPVKFIGFENLLQKRIVKINFMNEIHIVFHSRIEDHLKNIGCQAGKDILHDTIKIFHHPKSLEIYPNIDGYVRNGTNITCKTNSGYPSPTSKWYWVSGPENSEKYFTIDSHSGNLHINRNAPIESRWIFECIVVNNIPNSLNKGHKQLIYFTVGEKPISHVTILTIIFASIGSIMMLIIIACQLRKRLCASQKYIYNNSAMYNKYIDDSFGINFL